MALEERTCQVQAYFLGLKMSRMRLEQIFMILSPINDRHMKTRCFRSLNNCLQIDSTCWNTCFFVLYIFFLFHEYKLLTSESILNFVQVGVSDTDVRRLCLRVSRVDWFLFFFLCCFAASFEIFSTHFLLSHGSKRHDEKLNLLSVLN